MAITYEAPASGLEVAPISYAPSDSGSTSVPFGSGVEEVGLIDKPSEGGSFTNDSVGSYASAITEANKAIIAKNAAESARDAALVSENNMAGAITVATANMVEDEQVLTDVPANAVFTDTVYSHPASHSISTITDLQDTLDSLETSHTSLTLDGGYF